MVQEKPTTSQPEARIFSTISSFCFPGGITVQYLHINAVFFKPGGDAQQSQGRHEIEDGRNVFHPFEKVAAKGMDKKYFHRCSVLNGIPAGHDSGEGGLL